MRQVRLPNQSVHILRNILRDARLDTDAPFQAAGIPADLADRPGATVSGFEELAFQLAFVKETEDRPDLWLRAGWHHGPLTLGLLGLALLAAPTLEDLAEVACTWSDYTYTLAEYRPVLQAGTVVGLEMCGESVPRELREFAVYRDLGSAARVLHDIWHGGMPPTRIELPRCLPWTDGWNGIAAAVETGSHAVRWVWPEEAARRPLPNGNRLLYESCRLRYRRVQDGLANPAPLVDRLLDLMETAGVPLPLATAAKDLHMSSRTLERRLNDQGLRYRDLRQRTHIAEAKRLLTSSSMSVSEIAHRLGYADVSSFTYAFKARTGFAPSTWRQTGATTPVRAHESSRAPSSSRVPALNDRRGDGGALSRPREPSVRRRSSC